MGLDSLQDLRVFVQVVASGSLTEAGNLLGMSTPLVSRRLSRLEAELGSTLLVRSPRGLRLTEEGRALLPRSRRLLEEAEAAEAELAGAALEGQVRLALPSLALQFGFVDALGSFLARHPRISLQVLLSDRLPHLQKEGLDLALHLGPLEDGPYRATLLATPDIALAAAPSYLERAGSPAAPSDLASHECLRFLARPPQTRWRLLGPGGHAVDAEVGGRFECDDSRTLQMALYAGLGIGHRPAHLLGDEVRSGRLREVLPGYRFALPSLYLLRAPHRMRSRKVAAVARFLQGLFPGRG